MPTPVYDFTWKGQSAHDVYGVETLALGSVCVAERRDDSAAVAGRSGLVHRWDGAVEEVDQTLTVYLPYAQPGRTVAAFSQIRAWLKGYGRLTLSTEPGYYRLARLADLIALDPVVEGFEDLKGQVIFRCDPYLYYTSAPAQTLAEAGFLTNPGTAAAAPTIRVNATGDIDLMIGGQTVLLTDLTGAIILDCAAQEAYSEDANGLKTNLNDRMAGDFPLLKPGANAISWSLGEGAALTSVVITPNWRDEA